MEDSVSYVKGFFSFKSTSSNGYILQSQLHCVKSEVSMMSLFLSVITVTCTCGPILLVKLVYKLSILTSANEIVLVWCFTSSRSLYLLVCYFFPLFHHVYGLFTLVTFQIIQPNYTLSNFSYLSWDRLNQLSYNERRRKCRRKTTNKELLTRKNIL